MNEQLQAKLVEILAGIHSATKAAGDFALEQLPDIAQQYVMYGRVLYAVLAVLALLVFCTGFLALAAVRRKVLAADAVFAKRVLEYDEKRRSAAYPGSEPYRAQFFEAGDVAPLQFIPFAIGTVFFAFTLSPLILVWFAPKVWLLKEIASLIK